MNFGTEKDVLINKYRFALEQALAKAEFLTRPDVTVIQAFLIFLVLVRRHDDTRFSWTLTALLIRISQALGLHRDGTHFPNLTPYQIEMRRRLFWAVCVLDLRSAEDQGTDLTVVDGTFDTQLPLNINDADISPESSCLPEPRQGTTDMAFSLIRYEICALSRRLHTVSTDMSLSSAPDAGKSLEEREGLLTEVYQRVKDRLLKDSSNPMFWVASNITRVIIAKMTLVIYQPVLFPGPGNRNLSREVRTRLFNAALDVFEYSHILNTDPRCKQWRWMFQTWSHWHALAYTLVEASHRAWGPKAERAWNALNLTFMSPNPAELEKLASHHAVWMPIRKLYLKVKKHREAEVARLQADPQAARELELQDQSGAPPTNLGSIPSSVKGAVALERWRKLVNLPPQDPAQAPQPQQQPTEPTQQQSQAWPPENGQLAQQSNTAGSTGSIQPGAIGNYPKTEMLEYLDSAMTAPSFIPTDFIPLWANEASDEIARAAFFAYPGPDMPRVDSAMAGFVPGTPIPGLHHDVGSSQSQAGIHPQQQQPQQPQQQQQQPPPPPPQPGAPGQPGIVQTPALNEDNLPPWLWPATGSPPDILRMPSNMNAEEMDINMDEGFDWQTWQESLGRYELEANGGRAGSTWGPGL